MIARLVLTSGLGAFMGGGGGGWDGRLIGLAVNIGWDLTGIALVALNLLIYLKQLLVITDNYKVYSYIRHKNHNNLEESPHPVINTGVTFQVSPAGNWSLTGILSPLLILASTTVCKVVQS